MQRLSLQIDFQIKLRDINCEGPTGEEERKVRLHVQCRLQLTSLNRQINI